MSRLLFLIVFMSSLLSCKSIILEKEDIIGQYRFRGTYGVTSDIILNADNTFEYSWVTGLTFGTTEGTWHQQGNNLILNSDRQSDTDLDFEVIERDKTDTSQYEIDIIDLITKEEIFFVYCALMKDTIIIKTTESDLNGDCVLPFDENANYLSFSFIGYHDAIIPIDQLNTNSFTLELREHEYYQYFTNTEWKIKGGRIYDPKIRRDKYVKKNFYEKVVIE